MQLAGSILGRYRLVTELGAGGMGTVYYAEHVSIGRRAAVKVLDPEHASDQGAIERFFAEARSVNALRHPNIVDIEDLAREGDLHYLVMELLEGETLGARLERERHHTLAPKELLTIVKQIAAAIGAAHDLGMVHRDLKPENVFLARDRQGGERVKVLDFGIVKLSDGRATQGTEAGIILGTPTYMSPEQCKGSRELDGRSDVYSLGVVMYESLTGQRPFQHEHVLALLSAHQWETPVPPAQLDRSIPVAVSEVVMAALAKHPGDRPATARLLAERLEEACTRRDPRATAPSAPQRPAVTSVVAQRAQAQRVGTRLSAIVEQRVSKGKLVIPAMPEACLDCLSLLRARTVSMQSVAERMALDPLLTARLLQVASSSVNAARERVVDVETALVRLGVEAVQALLMDMASRQVFISRDPLLRTRMMSIWRRSVATGLAAEALAEEVDTPITKGRAKTAGLLRDVGHPIVAVLLMDVERRLAREERRATSWVSDEVFGTIVREHGPAVGLTVARRWQLPPDVVECIGAPDAWDARAGARSITNLVRMAGALAATAGFDERPDVSQVVATELAQGRAIVGTSPEVEARISGVLAERVGAALAPIPVVARAADVTRVRSRISASISRAS